MPAGLLDLVEALKLWLAPTGRPIFAMKAQGRPETPFAVLGIAGTLGTDAEVMSLEGPVASNTELVVNTFGSGETDALWLDDQIYRLLTSAPPAGLPCVIGQVIAPASATLVPSEGTLVHAEHRYGISYR